MWRRRRILVPATGAGRAAVPAGIEAPLAEALARGILEWRQEGSWWSPSWWLAAGDRRVATLRPAGVFGRRADVESGAGRWVVRATGVLGAAVLVREEDATELLRYHSSLFRGGRIECSAGTPLRWAPEYFARGGAVNNDEGFEVLALRMRNALFRREGEVRISDLGRRQPDIGPLVVLAWWLMLRAGQHSAAHWASAGSAF